MEEELTCQLWGLWLNKPLETITSAGRISMQGVLAPELPQTKGDSGNSAYLPQPLNYGNWSEERYLGIHKGGPVSVPR